MSRNLNGDFSDARCTISHETELCCFMPWWADLNIHEPRMERCRLTGWKKETTGCDKNFVYISEVM